MNEVVQVVQYEIKKEREKQKVNLNPYIEARLVGATSTLLKPFTHVTFPTSLGHTCDQGLLEK